MQVRASVKVERPPAEVFAVIANPDVATKWRTHLVSAKGSSSAVGDTVVQTYLYEGKSTSTELVVSRFERPERLEFEVAKPARIRIAFHCSPEDGGTRVSMTLSGTIPGPAALLSGRIEREAEALAKSDLAKLKKLVESAR